MKRATPSTSASRASTELATLVSAVAVALAYALHRFAGVGEAPIVLGTLLLASIVGWNQPAVRRAQPRRGRLVPVVVPVRRPHA